MKDKKHKKGDVKLATDIDLVLNEDLDKFTHSEFTPEKVKKAELKFSKQIVHN